MKKSVLTFCTVILLATQAHGVDAKEVDTKSNVDYFQSVSDYRLKVNASFKMIQLPMKKGITTQQQSTTNETTDNAPKETKQEVTQTAPKETVEEPKQETTKEVTQEETTSEPKAATTESVSKTEPVKQEVTTTASDIDIIEQQVVELTNKERAKNGLPAFEIDKPLMAAAREKSQDMNANNYFSHTSPTFGSPFDRMKALGISYKMAGENIAKGQTSAAQVVEAWMNSEGHRANILNKDFTHIGVGYVKSEHIWTQQFIKK